jgi:hypothetical protein
MQRRGSDQDSQKGQYYSENSGISSMQEELIVGTQ